MSSLLRGPFWFCCLLDIFGVDLDTASVPFKSVSLEFQNIWESRLREQNLDTFEKLQSLSMIPMIRMYGVTRAGASVALNVFGFFPYFYCKVPMANCCSALHNKLQGIPNVEVLEVIVEKKQSIMHYSEGTEEYCRVTVALPSMVGTCRGAIERGLNVGSVTVETTAFDANIPFVLRYMVDSNTTGSSWITVPAGTATRRFVHPQKKRCCLELDVHYEDLVPHLPDAEFQDIPALRVLSFDIECIKMHGKGFPDPAFDPVIQISSVLALHGSESRVQCIFTLDECAGIADAYVFWFEEERELIRKWAEFVQRLDPDFITGYNCINFDLNYLVLRAKALKFDLFLGRIEASASNVSNRTLSSKALGHHENKDINVEGRVLFDVLELVRRDYKLKSYTLNAVSFEFLKQQKEDVHYSQIADLQRGTPETRRRIAVYCIKDAVLPLRLIEKLLFMYNYVEMARVTGVPISFLLTRGQQIRVTSQLLRRCRPHGLLLPSVLRGGGGETQYEGATVLEPVKGLYKQPIATLDFASLYPSIMIAHNLCYSTLVPAHMKGRLRAEQVTTTTTDPPHYFVKAGVKKGLLPAIVEDLILARKKAKKQMAAASDPLTKMVLNGRQLALKITANSVYGYTGATAGGQLPCVAIATSITCFGRDLIATTKERVLSLYKRTVGPDGPSDYNAEVIYGDTDSVMVNFGVESTARAMQLGEEAAALISKEFLPPIRLEFEKVYRPFLLMNKKRYAGLLYTNPDKPDKMDSKGIETVRRDFNLLVKQIIDRVLQLLLVKADVEAAKEYTRQRIADLLQNNIDLSLLVVTKSIGKTEYGNKLAHVELANRMKLRDAGTAPGVGDRVSYVIVQGRKDQAQYERAEDPLYVLEKNIPIDTQHYLDALKKPLSRIFEGVMKNPETLFSLGGTHMMRRKIAVSADGVMTKFLKAPGFKCVGCNCAVKAGALCAHCKTGSGAKIVCAKYKELRGLEKAHSDLWTQCQRCQGSLHQDVICQNRDCPIFYRRTKTKKDLAELRKQVDRLTIEW
eukprot:GHVT01085555.1.p1 GENE.GHVT01085555.1~~GHVT01085555.1.p1  ORF type:complete len:1029 (+),score=189.08 GHVT01085555.1:3620-6706(+)